MTATDEAIEAGAIAIWNTWQWKAKPGWVPWVERGNSDMQGEARSYARAAYAAVFPHIRERMAEMCRAKAEFAACSSDVNGAAAVAALSELAQEIEELQP